MHPTPRPAALAPGTDVAGYLIDGAMGSSPSSTSYAATDRNTGHRVTLHVLAPHLSADPRLRADLRAGTVDPQPIVGSPYLVDRGEYGPDLWIATPAAPTGVLPVVPAVPGSSPTALGRSVVVIGGAFLTAGLVSLIVSLAGDGLRDALLENRQYRGADVDFVIRSLLTTIPWNAATLGAVVALGIGSRRLQGCPPRWSLTVAIIAVTAISEVVLRSSLLATNESVADAGRAFDGLLSLILGGLAVAACRGPVTGRHLVAPAACLSLAYGGTALGSITYVLYQATDYNKVLLTLFQVLYDVGSAGFHVTTACAIAVFLIRPGASSVLSTAAVSALTIGIIYVVVAELTDDDFYLFNTDSIGASTIGPVAAMTVAAVAGAALGTRIDAGRPA